MTIKPELQAPLLTMLDVQVSENLRLQAELRAYAERIQELALERTMRDPRVDTLLVHAHDTVSRIGEDLDDEPAEILFACIEGARDVLWGREPNEYAKSLTGTDLPTKEQEPPGEKE